MIAGTETPQYNCGIYIDVFVLDAYIEDSSKLHSQLKERHYWEIFINKFHYFKPSKSLLKRIIGNILHYTICKIVPYHFVIHLYNKTLTRYNGKTDRISLITHTECFALKYWCRLSDFHNIIEVPFENMIIPIPANYDEILKHMYGDYMTFPPAEKGELGMREFLNLNRIYHMQIFLRKKT